MIKDPPAVSTDPDEPDYFKKLLEKLSDKQIEASMETKTDTGDSNMSIKLVDTIIHMRMDEFIKVSKFLQSGL